jgi:Nuclease A inhibitor-like protein
VSKQKQTAKGAPQGQPGDPVLAALSQAAQGLRYTSETDAPLEPFLWDVKGDLTEAELHKRAGVGTDEPVGADTLEDFFRAVPPEDRPQFDKLAATLRAQLSGIKVYRVGGEAEKTAFIVGKTKDGRWAGLKTTVVET